MQKLKKKKKNVIFVIFDFRALSWQDRIKLGSANESFTEILLGFDFNPLKIVAKWGLAAFVTVILHSRKSFFSLFFTVFSSVEVSSAPILRRRFVHVIFEVIDAKRGLKLF